jgi:hypothetical protein
LFALQLACVHEPLDSQVQLHGQLQDSVVGFHLLHKLLSGFVYKLILSFDQHTQSDHLLALQSTLFQLFSQLQLQLHGQLQDSVVGFHLLHKLLSGFCKNHFPSLSQHFQFIQDVLYQVKFFGNCGILSNTSAAKLFTVDCSFLVSNDNIF